MAVIVVGGCGWYADRRERAHESVAVAACEHRLREASALSDVTIGFVSNYVTPVGSEHAEVQQQLHLADLMADPARRVLPRVWQADRACRAVAVRPWHFSLAARRQAATAYSGALVTLLQAVAAQGDVSFREESVIGSLRTAAGAD